MAILCISICLYPINVKTAEPIGPNFFVEPRVRRDPFMDDLISKICLLFYNACKEKMFTFEKEDGCEAPQKPRCNYKRLGLCSAVL